MDGGAWWATVQGVAKSRTRLSSFTFTFHFHALEKEMATHSSVLAWRIPGAGEPDGLPSMGSCRVGHDWSDLAAVAAYIYIYIYAHTHTNTYTEGEEGVRGWDGWMASLMQCTWTWANFAWHVPWSHKELDMIGWLNNDNIQITLIYIMFT